MRYLLAFIFIVFLPANIAAQILPPKPFLPIPTARQLAYQERELALFVHFGVNTYTDMEWGDGTEDPAIFNPVKFDARQWVRVAKETGFKTIILTAKHHDGFALWPSKYTDHSVKKSPWKEGRGDIIAELAQACREEGINMGLYLSPWDQHEPSYGDETAYNEYYLEQLRELMTQYGPLVEVWFDGAKGENAKDMEYDFPAFWATVRQYQPDAVMFSDAGPDIRWIGNERGYAGETNWSTMDASKVGIGWHGIGDYLNAGEAGTKSWIPGECNTSIRPGWFWHPNEAPKSVETLMDIYFGSLGRNCVLLLNIPPNRDGLFSDEDVERLYEFKAARDAIFNINLARGKKATSDNVRGNHDRYAAYRVLDHDPQTYWVTDNDVTSGSIAFDIGQAISFNVIRIEEPISMGQRVARYRVEALVNDEWLTVSNGTTIGNRKLDRTEGTVTAQHIRLVIEEALANPLISEFGLHLDPSQ